MTALTLEVFTARIMATTQSTPEYEWSDFSWVEPESAKGTLKYRGKVKLTPLRFSDWDVLRNLEFTRLRLTVTSQPATLKKWVEALGMLGQPHDVLVKTPEFQVTLIRPVCTYSSSGLLVLHFMNCSPCLQN